MTLLNPARKGDIKKEMGVDFFHRSDGCFRGVSAFGLLKSMKSAFRGSKKRFQMNDTFGKSPESDKKS